MTTANTGSRIPMTQTAVRSLLWGGAADQPQPLPDRAADLDELTLAKIRLLELRKPPGQQASALLHNPVPWALGAFLLGAVVSRSPIVRKAVAFAVAKTLSRTVGQTVSAFAGRRGAGNGRHNGRHRRGGQPAGVLGRVMGWMKMAS